MKKLILFFISAGLVLFSFGCCGSGSAHRSSYQGNEGAGSENSIVQFIGEKFKYSGTMTSESESVDVFSSTLPAGSTKTMLTNYMEPFKPATESYGPTYYLSYSDAVVVIDSWNTELSKTGLKASPDTLTRIRVFSPDEAGRQFNQSVKYVYVHEYYDPYYYHHHRNRYLSVHFHGHYAGWYRSHYSSRWGHYAPPARRFGSWRAASRPSGFSGRFTSGSRYSKSSSSSSSKSSFSSKSFRSGSSGRGK